MHENEEMDYNTKFDFGIWKKLYKILIVYKNDLKWALGAMGVLAFAEAALPIMNTVAIDDFITPQSYDNIGWFIATYIFLIFTVVVTVFMFIKYAGKIQIRLAYDIRQQAFEKLQSLSYSFFDTNNVGWLMSRVTSDTRRISHILSWGVIDIVWSFLNMTFIAIVMMVYNMKLALIVLSVIPIMFIIVAYLRKKILIEYRAVRKINSKITGLFNEGIGGAKTTKTLNLESKNLKNFNTETRGMRRSSVRAAMFSALMSPAVLIVGYTATSLGFYFGGIDVIDEVITVGVLYLFITNSIRFIDPIMQVASIFAEMQQAQASAERVLGLIDTVNEITDSEEVIGKYGTLEHPKTENYEKLHGDIKFDKVTFKYKTGEQVLTDFDLDIKAGSSVALVGHTGAGKSTIVNLICRFYEPSEGKIYIDGRDYKERSVGWLHSNLGYVLQSPHLFSGTIRDNIRYGKLDATDEEIEAIAKVVNIDKFVEKFESGFDTEVGEGGSKLSVGEKQLVSFARALISDPAIMILDEATSSIDTETEKMIQEAIDKMLEGRTSFIIAHRLSTIVSSDLILVLKDGEIIESGTHQELIENEGHYYNLYTNQFVEEQISSIL